MSVGLIGRKAGMTRVFTEDGVSVPVTVIEVEPNRVTQVKTEETDGYSAVQVTVGSRRANRVNKAAAGHLRKQRLKRAAVCGSSVCQVTKKLMLVIN